MDAGVKELTEMTIGRIDDPENPLPPVALEVVRLFGAGSRIPSGPAVMVPRQQAEHMIAVDPRVRILFEALEPTGPSTHGGMSRCASSTPCRPLAALARATPSLAAEAVRGLERAKWRLWHGRWPGCRRKLAALCRWARAPSIRGIAGNGRLEHHAGELLGYLERNQGALVHYAARRRTW